MIWNWPHGNGGTRASVILITWCIWTLWPIVRSMISHSKPSWPSLLVYTDDLSILLDIPFSLGSLRIMKALPSILPILKHSVIYRNPLAHWMRTAWSNYESVALLISSSFPYWSDVMDWVIRIDLRRCKAWKANLHSCMALTTQHLAMFCIILYGKVWARPFPLPSQRTSQVPSTGVYVATSKWSIWCARANVS